MLLLDEPLSNLDAVLRKRMRLDLRELQQRLGIATIFVTHDQDEAFEMSDRVVLLNRGRVEQVGTPEELYDDPATRFAAEFIGETNLIEGVVAATVGATVTVDTTAGARYDAFAPGQSLRSGDPVYVMIRPERIDLVSERPAGVVSMLRRSPSECSPATSSPSTSARITALLHCSKPSLAEYGRWRRVPPYATARLRRAAAMAAREPKMEASGRYGRLPLTPIAPSISSRLVA